MVIEVFSLDNDVWNYFTDWQASLSLEAADYLLRLRGEADRAEACHGPPTCSSTMTFSLLLIGLSSLVLGLSGFSVPQPGRSGVDCGCSRYQIPWSIMAWVAISCAVRRASSLASGVSSGLARV